MQGPWISLYSGLAIAVFVLSINMFGDGLRDILDPKLRR
ncbi:MAG: ABC transporter permease [Thermovirgaceae bacterium]